MDCSVGGQLIYQAGVDFRIMCAALEPLKLVMSSAPSWSDCTEIELGSAAEVTVLRGTNCQGWPYFQDLASKGPS